MSHTSGIRHYKLPHKDSSDNDNDDMETRIISKIKKSIHHKSYKSIHTMEDSDSNSDSTRPEFFRNRNYRTTKEALGIFINDELLFEPGNAHNYASYNGLGKKSTVKHRLSINQVFVNLFTCCHTMSAGWQFLWPKLSVFTYFYMFILNLDLKTSLYFMKNESSRQKL